MILKELKPRKALNKAFLKVKPNRTEIEGFKTNLITLLDRTNDTESEEFHKNLVSDFLKDTYYKQNHFINTKGRNDLVIHNGQNANSTVGVILEAKKPTNKSEMITTKKLNAKAFQELVLYYLRERITHKNLEVKHLVATNINEWFIFDATLFDRLFAQNKNLVKQFNDFEAGRLADTKTDFFYKQIAEPFIADITAEIEFTYFNIQDFQKPLRNTDKADDNSLIALFKLLSPEHLLKLPFTNDSNSLDKRFYSELLHIIGLTETKEGSKKLIERNKAGERHTGTILEDAIIQLDSLDKLSRLEKPNQFGNTQQERLFNVALELSITWINRILFLKLLEAQLITYHKGDKSFSFLNLDKIKNYDDLNSLFFQVLARKYDERNEDVKKAFEKTPYLNSSLFEPTDIEQVTLFISNLKDDKTIPIFSQTVLKDQQGKKRTGNISTLQYLFEFLDAYDFGAEGGEEIQEDNKTLINASVLGLIFEKINGYKDGSFFTPGFITMYMCRETIRKAVVQKFNETKKWNCTSIEELYDKIDDRKEANKIVNSIKICDPAVGSGHFLVSALNEMIAVKNDLKILQDLDEKRLKEYQVEVLNDELIVTDEEGELFEYNPSNKESQRIQETLFHEKQTIIENCLFGVDINSNSVKICRLRLWIELLKNAYYKNSTELETLPNIDINIKCGNSLVSRFAIDADLKQALKKSKWTIDSYRIAVDTYRNAESKEQKREMERLIADIKTDFRSEISLNDPKVKKLRKLSGDLYQMTNQGQLFEMSKKEKADWNKKVQQLTEETKKLEAEIEEIKANKVFENAFEWRFEFPEVLNDDGDFVGFDVVMGNPPWGASLSEKELKFIKEWNSDIVVRMIDTFMFFINLSFIIKSNQGLICQIIPDVILYQVDNIKLREKILANYQLLIVANLGDNIFEDVARPSCILQIGNKSYKPITKVFEYSAKDNVHIDDIIPFEIETTVFSELPNTVFATRNITGYKILSRFKQSVISDLIDNDGIQRGISPDLKEAFIIDETIINENSLERDYIFPTITGGRDVTKYLATDIGKRVIYTKKSDPESNIINIINYVSNFKSRITCTEVKQGKHPFWSLHRAREKEIFEKDEKIVGVITGDKISVSIDKNRLYPTDGMYIFASNGVYSNHFLVGLLNSKLITYFYRLISMEENRTLAQIKPSVLQNIPASNNFNDEKAIKVEKLTVEIIENIKSNNPIDELISEIDQLVYQLYELTEEEIKIVEGN
ncbi:MAG: class I SAM-dependent DNA methyltransferase [Flavobacteriales bacterium]|nr:class I SAM-dependent DNA methyltransferase [Flavobacteriales bacterium]